MDKFVWDVLGAHWISTTADRSLRYNSSVLKRLLPSPCTVPSPLSASLHAPGRIHWNAVAASVIAALVRRCAGDTLLLGRLRDEQYDFPFVIC